MRAVSVGVAWIATSVERMAPLSLSVVPVTVLRRAAFVSAPSVLRGAAAIVHFLVVRFGG